MGLDWGPSETLLDLAALVFAGIFWFVPKVFSHKAPCKLQVITDRVGIGDHASYGPNSVIFSLIRPLVSSFFALSSCFFHSAKEKRPGTPTLTFKSSI